MWLYMQIILFTVASYFMSELNIECFLNITKDVSF